MGSVRAFAFVFSFLYLSITSLAADLDVKGAKDRYDRQRRSADLAKERLNTQAALLANAQSQVDVAHQDEDRAEAVLRTAQQGLVNIDNRISSLERDISNYQSEIDNQRNRLNQVERDLAPLYVTQTNLQNRLPDIRRRLQQVNERIAEVEAKDPQSPQLAELRQRKQRLEQEERDADRQLSSVNWDISRLESDRSSLTNSITTNERYLRDKQLDLSSAQRERDRQLVAIQDARDDLRRAEQRTETAQRQVDAIRPTYISAQNESQREEQLASEAYAYYQQVVANYNAALKLVYDKADAAASQHGSQEAAERAPEKGKVDGNATGLAQGKTKGSKDAAERDHSRGYADGRANGPSAPELADFYRQGLDRGALYALEKGKVEDLPRGYNDALKAHFAADPSQKLSVDISEAIGSDPGGSGALLALKEKAIGEGLEPIYELYPEPKYGAPAYQIPGVSVPTVMKVYYNPPCSGLVLAEFEPLCVKRYESTYVSAYDANYQSVYRTHYKPSYEAQAKLTYESTLAVPNAGATAQGRSEGALEQGTLDGFAKSIAEAKKKQYLAGKEAFRADLATGAAVFFREASLTETTGDGLFTPGEKLKLKLVIDNYGLQATALAKVRVRLTGQTGLGAANFTVRELPALAADTRTTLEGTVTLPLATEFPKEAFNLSGTLEVEQDGSWKSVAKFAPTGETRFPVELTEVVLPKDPKVGETVKATFRYVNNLRDPVELAKVSLKVPSNIVTFPAGTTGEIAKLESGKTGEIALDIKPGAWVGENTYVKFQTETALSDAQKFTQGLPKFIHMNRNASVLLFDMAGKPVPGSTFTVKAGTRVSFLTRVQLHAKAFVPGPFQLRVGNKSVPEITSTSNTTVGVNYGGLSPTSPPGNQAFYFDVPKSLAGRTEWVMITLTEGAAYIHTQMVYLNIIP